MGKNQTVKMIMMTASAKFDNYCVTGIDLETGEWIRLVSPDIQNKGALTPKDIMYDGGETAEILDIVTAPYLKKQPILAQPENYLIDRSKKMEKNGKVSLSDVLSHHPLDNKKCNWLFESQYPSIKEEYLPNIGYSLLFVEITDFKAYIVKKEEGKKLKADFCYNGELYKEISVTDQHFYNELARKDIIKRAYAVVSLGEPYEGRCYKFVSKVFFP